MMFSRVSLIVSIHAPVKGATAASWVSLGDIAVSIHAPVKGATARGCRVRLTASFNPRPREGGDKAEVKVHEDTAVSIHAPVKGATAIM